MAKKRVHRPPGSRPVAPATRTPRPSPSRTSSRPSAREQFEDASRPLVARMQATPTFLIPGALAVALFLGLAIRAPWAGAFLVMIGLFLTWLTALSWPTISPTSRLLRVGVDIGVTVLGVLKLLGRL